MPDDRSSGIDPEPRLGVFWFIPTGDDFRFVSSSLPFSAIATIGGLKTFPYGHHAVWREIVRGDPLLREFEYEYFPRGRVNWLEEENRFLLLADAQIFLKTLESVVVAEFWLEGSNVHYRTDAHYRVNALPTLFR